MTTLQAQTCPNCGAPLKLDSDGLCSWCRTPIRTTAGPFAEERGLIGALLRAAAALIEEPAVQRAIEKQGLANAAQTLTRAVVAARARVEDSGLVLGGAGGDIKIYRPEEIWTFNLTADLIADLVSVDNLSKLKRGAVQRLLVVIDANLGSHWSRSTIGNAGLGPEELRSLRDAIPHRRLTKL